MEAPQDTRRASGASGSHSRRSRGAAEDWFEDRLSRTETLKANDDHLISPSVGLGAPAVKGLGSGSTLTQSSYSIRRPPSGGSELNRDFSKGDGLWDRRGAYPDTAREQHGNPRSPPSAPYGYGNHYNRREDRRNSHHEQGTGSTLQGSSAGGHVSIDARRATRADVSRPPSLKTEPGGPALPGTSSLRSGGQTPKTPFAPSLSDDDRIGDLTTVLNEFTAHVAAMASLTLQRDSAKREYEKREHDFQASRRHHAAFAPLAEQQENCKVKAQRRFEELDNQLDKHIAARERLSKTIATKVISQSNAKDIATLERLEAGYHDLFRMKPEVDQIRSLHARVTETKKVIENIQSEQSTLISSFGLLKSLREEVGNRSNDFLHLKTELSKVWEEVAPLSSLLDKTASDLQKLSETVEGKEHGLVQAVRSLEITNDKCKDLLTQVDDHMDNFDRELDNYEKRTLALESSVNADVQTGASTAAGEGGATDLVRRAEVARLETDLQSFRAEQQSRDDMVADEIEKTQQMANKLEKELVEMRQGHETALARIDTWVAKVEGNNKPAADEDQSATKQNGAQANSARNARHEGDAIPFNSELASEASRLQDELQRQQHLLSQHTEQLEAVKYSVKNLDGRFSKLTTEHLARQMMGQLSKIYPQANTIVASLDQTRQSHDALQMKIGQMSEQISKLGAEQQKISADVVAAAAATMPTGSNEGDTYSKTETDELLVDLRGVTLEAINLSKDTATKLNELEKRFQVLWDSSAKEFARISLELEDWKSYLQRQQQQQVNGDATGMAVGGPITTTTAGDAGRTSSGASSTSKSGSFSLARRSRTYDSIGETSNSSGGGGGSSASTSGRVQSLRPRPPTTNLPDGYLRYFPSPSRHRAPSKSLTTSTTTATATAPAPAPATTTKPTIEKRGRKRRKLGGQIPSDEESDWIGEDEESASDGGYDSGS